MHLGVRSWIAVGVVAALVVAVPLALPRIITLAGSGHQREPSQLQDALSPNARELVEHAFADIDPTKTVDYHVHLVGAGEGESGARVSPTLLTWAHPKDHLRFLAYLSASGLFDEDRMWDPIETTLKGADRRYVSRLVSLIDALPQHGKYHLLAMDAAYQPDGTRNDAATEFYTPNTWVESVVAARPDLFAPTVSINPYRKDAIEELSHWAARGVRFVKWLPNTMGIDPSDPKIDPFYEAMVKNDMVLFTHAGEERAVEGDGAQRLGNPLLLRRPLDKGVKVVVAHCASLGTNIDLDDPAKKEVTNFSLFLRLMNEKRYDGLLFGEISALTLVTRLWEPLLTMMKYLEYHRRLVNGSDYPIPAVNVLVRLRGFTERAMITRAQMEALQEIYEYNPLLFDYVLKRTLSHPETAARFTPSIFLPRPELGPSLRLTKTATAAP